jgi:hypothetical protein
MDKKTAERLAENYRQQQILADLNPSARVTEFDRMNGPHAVWNDTCYFLSGAVRDSDRNGLLQPPPAEDYQRLQNICNYWRGMQKRAIENFEAFRERLAFTADTDPALLEKLKELQAEVGRVSAQLQYAITDLAATPEMRRIEENRRARAEEAEKRIEFQRELRTVRI